MEMQGSTEDRKKAIIAMLLRLQTADSRNAVRDFAYIHKVAVHLGLSASDVTSIEREIADHPFRPPADEKERMTILYYMLFLSLHTGKVTAYEEELLKEFGLRLGFRLDLTSELIQVVRTYMPSKVPPAALLMQIRKYLN